LNWVIKDGLGQLGGVAFAAWVGNRFDTQPKRIRFRAGVTLQLANALEILTPLFPKLFLVLASLSNMGKNMSWMASSATRAHIHQTLSIRDNLGDVTGKAASQTTAASLVGTALGVGLSAAFGSEFGAVMTAFVPCSAVCLYANYKALVDVPVHTMDQSVTELIFHHLITQGQVPTPEAICGVESVVFRTKSPFTRQIVVNGSLARLPPKHLEKMQTYEHYSLLGTRERAWLWMHVDAKCPDVLQAFFHACHVAHDTSANMATWPTVLGQLTAKGWDVENNHLELSRTARLTPT
jgi:hypothetical protein